MIQWFREKLRNFIDAEQEGDLKEYIGHGIGISMTDPDVRLNNEDTLNFTVTPARGGIIVQVRKYDNRTGDHNMVTHVIFNDENTSERISEIVSMELLRS